MGYRHWLAALLVTVAVGTLVCQAEGDSSGVYLLITSEALRAEFEPLVARRTSQGKTGKLLTLEYIEANYPGLDTQEKVRNCIRDNWQNHGTRWVSLGGDDAVVPVRTCKPVPAEPDTTAPGELYYADLDGGSWDADGDRIYGEPTDLTLTELTPEVAVGRIPVSSPEQARDYCAKVVAYETASPEGFSNSMMFICDDSGALYTGSARPWYFLQHDPVGNGDFGYVSWYWQEIQPYWQAAPMLECFGSHTSWDQSEWGDYQMSADHLVERMSSGAHHIAFSGHANWVSWLVEGGSFSTADAMRLTNPIPFILRSGGCEVSWFDYPGDCLAEAFLKNPHGGAVVVFGHARGISRSPQDELYYEIFQHGTRNVGEALKRTQTVFAPGVVSEPYWTLVYVLLGDPAIDLLPDESGRHLQVFMPSGLEHYDLGQDIVVRWNAAGTGFQVGERVRLEYSADSGATWSEVPGAESLPFDGRAFTWESHNLPAGSDYKVRVTSLTDQSISDASRRDFSIQGLRTLRITATALPARPLRVRVDGTHPGYTDYDYTIALGGAVRLKSDATTGYRFSRWCDVNGNTLTRRSELTLLLAGNKTVRAEYEPIVGHRDYYINDDVAELGFAAGNDENDGLSPLTPVRRIQEIIDRNAERSTIHISAGAYVENLVMNHGEKDVTFEGAGSSLTVIDGNQTASCFAACGVTNLSIRGFSFQRGYEKDRGAGMRLDNCTAEVNSCLFREGVAYCGAGLAITGGSAEVTNNVFTQNSANAQNQDITGWGGGVYAEGCSLELESNLIQENDAFYSGAGVSLWFVPSATITGNTIASNGQGYHTDFGGGISADHSHLLMSGNTISSNQAVRGGGMTLYNCRPMSGVTSSVFFQNQAGSYGGGLYVYGSDIYGENSQIRACTIISNSAPYGGGFFCDISRPSVSDCIVWGNSVDQIQSNAQAPLVTYSDVQGGFPGSGNIDTDPSFAAAEECHLAPGSPCVNAGDPDAAYPNQTDIDGEARVSAGRVDMGADEFAYSELATAKSRADGAYVNLQSGIVTASFPDCFYVESDSRTNGMRIQGAGQGAAIGARMDVSGRISTNADGEHYLAALWAVPAGSGSVDPLGMTNLLVGGGPFAYDPFTGAGQCGIVNGFGLNNIGLLVRTCGRVVEWEPANPPTWFVLDDGSGVGVKCLLPTGVEADQNWTRVGVTGVSSCEKMSEGLRRLIRVRSADDLTSED